MISLLKRSPPNTGCLKSSEIGDRAKEQMLVPAQLSKAAMSISITLSFGVIQHDPASGFDLWSRVLDTARSRPSINLH